MFLENWHAAIAAHILPAKASPMAKANFHRAAKDSSPREVTVGQEIVC